LIDGEVEVIEIDARPPERGDRFGAGLIGPGDADGDLPDGDTMKQMETR